MISWSKRRRRSVHEDWIWHVATPFVAYGAVLIASAVIMRHTESALFVIAPAALLLMFVGIHNAWDAATWMAIARHEGSEPETPPRADA